MVKIPAPAEMIQSDEEISEAWEEYQELIEKFKEVHSSVTEQRKQGPNTEAVRGDIKAMEEERKWYLKQQKRTNTNLILDFYV